MAVATPSLLVSVVVPTLNEEQYLPRCLASYRKQTYANIELIVSDGQSTDNTLAVARRFGATVITNQNTTVTMARQKGVEAASGEIIVGSDADTMYPPDHVARIVAHVTQNPAVVAVGGGGTFETHPAWLHWSWKLWYVFMGFLYRVTGLVLYVPAFNLAFTKEAFTRIGGYRTYLDFGGDELDVLGRLKKAGKVVFDPKLTTYPSSRRAREGFWNLIVRHTLIDYYGGYILAKWLKKPVIKGKPVR